MRYLLTILLIFTGAFQQLLSQEYTASATVSKNPVAVNEIFQLTVTVTNVNGQVKMPVIPGLAQRRGISTGQNHSIVNGQRQSEYTFGYTFQAQREGTIQIPAIQVSSSKGVFVTEPIELKVVSAREATGTQGAARGRNDDIFVAVEPSRRKVYLGQELVLNYYIYSRYTGLELENYTFPDLDGFWTETVSNENATWQRTAVNGVAYNRALLKSDVVFPQQSGTFKIENFKITGLVRTSFFNRNRVEAKSRPVTIEVLPLPPGKTGDFLGTYSNLQMKVDLSKTEFRANEAFNLEITLKGKGNLKLLQSPKIDFPKDFEVFEPKVRDNIRIEKSGESGSRTYTYVVIPRVPGNYSIPAISASYFDPASQQYRKLKEGEMRFNVERGSADPGDSYVFDSRTDVEVINQDIRYIKPHTKQLKPMNALFYGSGVFWGLFALAPIGFLLALFFHHKQRQRRSDMAGYRSSIAKRVAKKWLKEAAASVDDPDHFYAALLKALETYVSDKFGLARSNLSKAEIKQAFNSHGQLEMGEQIVDLMEYCEMARFSSDGAEVATTKLQEAQELITKIEQSK